MCKKFLVFFFLFCLLGITVFSQSYAQDNFIRVGISNQSFSSYTYNEAEFYLTGDASLIEETNNFLITDLLNEDVVKIKNNNGEFEVFINGKKLKEKFSNNIYIKSNSFIGVSNLQRAGKPALYRTCIKIVKSTKNPNQFYIVNYLSLEDYLKGVVPNEMPVSFGLNALKAQAIAARNYAIRPRATSYKEFDICDSVACQVYFGANTEKGISTQAVDETNGVVALYGGEIITAVYSSTAGGYTENFENVFLSYDGKNITAKPVPYLKGVPDDANTPLLNNEEDATNFYTSSPQTFDNASSLFRWQKSWDKSELEDILKKNLKKYSTTPFVSPKIAHELEFGEIQEIVVTKRGVSGKVVSLNIITDKATFTISKELIIRQVFTKDGKMLPSANVVFKKFPGDFGFNETYVAYGGGLGHGVGMSQYGAGAMAKKGYTFDKILKHYYSNIDIGTKPVILENENYKNVVSQTFYTKAPKAIVVIDNNKNLYPSKISLLINGMELALDAKYNLGKVIKYNISKYIKSGMNDITFILPITDTHKKTVKAYIILKEADDE